MINHDYDDYFRDFIIMINHDHDDRTHWNKFDSSMLKESVGLCISRNGHTIKQVVSKSNINHL